MPLTIIANDDDDHGKAQTWFRRAKSIADTGNFEYAIHCFVTGLGYDPDNVEGHRALREVSLRRKADGGKDLGMIDKMRMPKSNDAKQAMLNAEKLLAYDPGNRDRIVRLLQAVRAAELPGATVWIEAVWAKADDC